jgi:hypothetical protein
MTTPHPQAEAQSLGDLLSEPTQSASTAHGRGE